MDTSLFINCNTTLNITDRQNAMITVGDIPIEFQYDQLPLTANGQTFRLSDLQQTLHNFISTPLISSDHNITFHILSLIRDHSPQIIAKAPTLTSNLADFFSPDRISGSHVVTFTILGILALVSFAFLIILCKYTTMQQYLFDKMSTWFRSAYNRLCCCTPQVPQQQNIVQQPLIQPPAPSAPVPQQQPRDPPRAPRVSVSAQPAQQQQNLTAAYHPQPSTSQQQPPNVLTPQPQIEFNIEHQ